MSTTKSIKYGVLSLSAVLLLAACDDNDTLDTTPADDDTEMTDDAVEDPTVEEGMEDAEDDTSDEGADDAVDDPNVEEGMDDAADDTSGDTGDSRGLEGMTFAVSLDDAIDMFYETFGSDANIEEIQFDRDNGRFVYEMDGWDGEYEYELDIDAETGDVVKQEQDDDDDSDDALDLDGIITPQEAMDVALEASGSGYVEEWTLEVEDGRTLYEVDVQEGDDQEIDALTGDVL